MRRVAIILGLTVLLHGPAQATDAIDWRGQFAGLTGVSITCVRTIKKKYAARVCSQLKNHAAARLKKAGIPHEKGETVFSKSKDPALVPPTALDRPLNLTIHVRATAPRPLGMDVRINASITYARAVEENGSNATPRRGELLLWQTGATAAATGGSRKLERAMVGSIKKRMNEILELMDKNWTR